jgi:hypothetical protein
VNERSVTPTPEVVICSSNSEAMLDCVFGTLSRQVRCENLRWTCLVVDNNCIDETQNVVSNRVSGGGNFGFRSMRETEWGLTPSGLRGVQTSKAKWIPFVADDYFLEPGRTAEAISFIEQCPTMGAFGDALVSEGTVAQWFSEQL